MSRTIAFRLLGAAMLSLALPGFAYAVDAKVFDTPEAAANGMVAALEKGTDDAIVELLGDAHNDELFTDDEASERENRKRAYDAAKEQMTIREDDSTTRTVLIGKDEWPVPFPIVKDDKGWHFDLDSGLDELLARRIGQNELAAIASLRAVVDAEEDYKAIDRDGDEVLEYAQKFVSSPGKKDGLYWEVPEGSNDPVSPLLSFVTQQEGYLQGRDEGDPVRGYDFRIITRQGAGAPGGRYDYIINGNMIGGYGVIATPDEYGNTGIMTFIVNQQGMVYEKDLGDDTALKAAAIQEYDLDDSWKLTEE
ncbi:MAG TPA: DUF2950 domain-containing protein [Dongiaceae bacterium]|nr:DUF2950 domain-containing protein [Dongiaceae bacterium]